VPSFSVMVYDIALVNLVEIPSIKWQQIIEIKLDLKIL
jgi:hypothetical protein